MFDAAGRGELGALYVVGSNSVSRYGIDPKALANTFIVVQDMFLTETAVLADVVLPVASLYEKSGTVTNTYGDLQLVKKAADRAGVRTDFELIVRLADRAGVNPRSLVPFGAASAPIWGRAAGRSPVRPIVMRSGSRPIISRSKSAPSIPFRFWMKSSVSFPATDLPPGASGRERNSCRDIPRANRNRCLDNRRTARSGFSCTRYTIHVRNPWAL